MPAVKTNSCLSYAKIEEYYHEWTIANLDYYLQDVKKFESAATDINGIEVKFEIQVKSYEQNGPFNLELSLYTLSNFPKYAKIQIDKSHFEKKLTIEHCGANKLITMHKDSNNWYKKTVLGYINCPNFAESIINNSILLKFKIIFYEKVAEKFAEKADSINSNISNVNKNFNLEYLLKNNKLSDVTFNLSNEEIKAHKCILAAQSDVFLKMFEQDMKEKAECKVKIEDINPVIFNAVIKYIYGAEINISKETVADFLYVAEKYDLKDLKNLCENHLFQNLNSENEHEVFKLACLYNLEKLKDKVLFLIAKKLQTFNFSSLKELNDLDQELIIKTFSSINKN